MICATVERQLFLPSPAPGAAVLAGTYYTRATGDDLVCQYTYMTRSDTCDVAFQCRSTDHGLTWSAPREIITGERRPEGMFRRHLRAGYVDPLTGRFLTLRTEGILPTDHPLEGMKQWSLYYAVSIDGGETNCVDEQIIAVGGEYDAAHPLPGVWRGRNSVMLGDMTCVPLTLADGTLLVPCQVSPIGPDGEYYNPGGGLTYTDAMVLRGQWRADLRLSWEASERVIGDPERTTRGMVEPTIAQLPDGRVLMVMRGSNDAKPHLPGYRWYAMSADGGRTWSAASPWCYDTGAPFFSPSACSQLLAHSSGKLFWLGNICPENPSGNRPRYPLVIGEVNLESGLLAHDTVRVVDTRGEGDSEMLTLSNFYAREDRRTGEVLLHLSRLFARQADDWTADALQYRIAVG